jgi:hypothetical protein
MNAYKFPQQKVLCDESPFSPELLNGLLEMVYAVSPPFTGYLKFAGHDSSLYFLFFFQGIPFSAGKFMSGKPIIYTIQELGEYLAATLDSTMTITLCETDPVLLKSMMLFLQEEPDVKAPASLIDIDHVVRQIGESGTNSLIALCRGTNINFFFFKDGEGALAIYSDHAFEHPEGMSVEEEMLLYAFQPGDRVQAYIFREMTASKAETEQPLDMASLYQLLTSGRAKNRRREDRINPADPAESQFGRRRVDAEISTPGVEGGKALFEALYKKMRQPSLVLGVESGPLQGERFTVTLPCIIGRKACDLILDDPHVSRRHAEIRMIEGLLIIEDLASTNGTKVNGLSIAKKRLVPNDLITIGPINLRVSAA